MIKIIKLIIQVTDYKSLSIRVNLHTKLGKPTKRGKPQKKGASSISYRYKTYKHE